ncbi:MBL fold metallo-hydrolase [Rossellomorea vietnamensis]|uniref:MBL fold metallo-hydrolase n=1 Tax=Rossellomorea aquimaris TaxID=189382 RepID=A0A5D4U0P1_9BACI|nr:MBL fold metallo-hydrolase [Rossellomorea aquimaris]TYS80888.1 MBL fold metallo-hydrolase [Rossellomorea aquimaris]
MKITQRNNLYQLAFMPDFFPVNCYLVEEEDSLTLIDTALPHCANAIMMTARKIGKPITRILLTHTHNDHIGALIKLKTINPDAELWIPEREERMLRGDRGIDPGESQTPIRGGLPKNMNIKADFLMKEGDRIGSLIALETPGHTPGSMSFLDSRDRSVIAGDAFQTRGRTAVSGQMVFSFPFPAMATWCKETALVSAEKIQSQNPSLLAAGHGKMLENPAEEIKKALMSAREKMKVIK